MANKIQKISSSVKYTWIGLTFSTDSISLHRNFFSKIEISVVYVIQFCLLNKWVKASRSRVNKVLSIQFSFLFIASSLPFHQSVMIEWIKAKWRRNSTRVEIPSTCCLNWNFCRSKDHTKNRFLFLVYFAVMKIMSLDELVSYFAPWVVF